MHRRVKLCDISSLITKGTTPTTIGYQFVGEGIPFLRAEDINGGLVSVTSVEKRITPECHEAMRRSQLMAGDVLVTIAGTIGRVGAVPCGVNAANCNQAISIVRINPEIFDLSFLLYAIRSDPIQQQLRRHGTTATITNVSLAQIGDLEVPLISLEEQRRVVDLLSRAEGIVRLRLEAQKKAAELIPALFLDMFGDPATNPKGWPVLAVKDFVARFVGGKNVQAGEDNASEFRILKVSAVTSGTYIEAEAKPAPRGYTPPNSHLVQEGDLLFSRANTEQLVGATALVESTNGRTLLPDKLWRFVWQDGIPVAPRYICTLFQNSSVRAMLSQIASGTSGSMKNISQQKLFTVSIPVAPYSRQLDFENKAQIVRSIESEQAIAVQKAEATFNALLARTFNGGETSWES